jgi:hypothetical protein
MESNKKKVSSENFISILTRRRDIGSLGPPVKLGKAVKTNPVINEYIKRQNIMILCISIGFSQGLIPLKLKIHNRTPKIAEIAPKIK